MQSLASQASVPKSPQSPLFSVQSVDPLAKLTDALDTRIQADTFPTRAPPPWEVSPEFYNSTAGMCEQDLASSQVGSGGRLRAGPVLGLGCGVKTDNVDMQAVSLLYMCTPGH